MTNTFLNAQSNYQHINGSGGSSGTQTQVHFAQQPQRSPYYSNNRYPVQQPFPPPPSQGTDHRSIQPLTNVQITPKTPHTIQYLPTSSAPAPPISTSTSTSSVNAENITVGGVHYLPQSANLGGNGKSRMQSAVLVSASKIKSTAQLHVVSNSVAPSTSASAPPSNSLSNVAPDVLEHRATAIPSRQQQRGQKLETSQILPSQQSLLGIGNCSTISG